MPFAEGENIGPYRIIEKLGQGGMATVYKAYHAALDRYVAMKVLHPAFHEAPNFAARFQREARVVGRLEHPGIVPVYDYAEQEGRPFLVMKYIEGETLKALAKERADRYEEARLILQPLVGDLGVPPWIRVMAEDFLNRIPWVRKETITVPTQAWRGIRLSSTT